MATVFVSCAGGTSGNETADDSVKVLCSPISLYLNPLQNSDYDYYSSYLPYFVNYPDDWAKMGLHGRPSSVKYSSEDHWTGGAVSVTYSFNGIGNLVNIVNSVLGRDEFIYDDGFKLQEIKRMKHVNWDGGAGQFVYADSLLVKRTISPSHSTSHTFSYYPGGVLKEITPDKGIYYSDLMKLGKLEFNGKGQLVRSESARSFNPFIFSVTGHDAGKSPNICTFKYDKNGLCIEKYEVISFRHHNNKVDTLKCISRYDYNDKGDLKTWAYEGACREDINGNNWKFANKKFSIEFDYKYDNHGNWVTRTITLPDCYSEIYELGKFYEMHSHGYFQSNKGVTAPPQGQKAVVTTNREIGFYYEEDPDEIKASIKALNESKKKARQEELAKNKELVKFTAAQAFGLYGDVKTMKEGKTYSFDEIGNITMIEWSSGTQEKYQYEGPLRFKTFEEGAFVNLSFTDNQRVISSNSGQTLETFTFDGEGRLWKHDFQNGSDPAEEELFYEGDGKIPVKKVMTIYDSSGNHYRTYVYSEIEIDEHGNWTKRRVNEYRGKEEYRIDEDGEYNSNGMWKENYTESRKLTYY